MQNAPVSNANDFKVVEFHNKEVFGFTPDMGCMYDGRPISGITGAPGINAGESITLPYHIGHRLATNLAKVAMLRMAPTVDPQGIPTGVPLWDDVKLENLKNSYLTELYSETKPVAMNETDRLMAKVEEYKKMVDALLTTKADTPAPKVEEQSSPVEIKEPVVGASTVFADKQEVLAELDKRGIKHDKRQNKANLEKLLV